MLTENLTLNLTTVHTLIRWRQAEPHPVLATTPTWRDEDTIRALDRHALAELEQHSVLRGGRPDDDLNDTIDALVRPDREFYGWITTAVDGGPFRYGVLAIAAYQEAVVVVRNLDTDTAVLSTTRPSELFGRFLDQLPPVGPAAGQPVSVPYQEFLAATEQAEETFAGFGTLRSPEARELDAVLDQPRTGGGTLYAAGRVGGLGTRRRSPRPVNYLDTVAGRWLTRLDTTVEGTVATIRPARRDLIAAELTEAERHLGRGE